MVGERTLTAAPAAHRGASGRRFFLGLAAVLTAVGLAAGGPELPRWIYLRAAVLDGEVWRLVTGQLVHAGGRHLAWNLAAVAVLGLALGPLAPVRRWLPIAAASAAATGVGLLLLSPGAHAVAGASALLHGLFAGAAALEIRRGSGAGWWLAAALALKLGVEQVAGSPAELGAGLGGDVAVDAHLWGALGGLAAGLALGGRPDRAAGGLQRRPAPISSRSRSDTVSIASR